MKRVDTSFDVSQILPTDSSPSAVLTATVVFDGERLPPSPVVMVAVPGGTYHRRYWDLQPRGYEGYSMAEYLATNCGLIFVAMDYFGGGDSTRPENGDFIGLETQARAAHIAFEELRVRLQTGTLVDGLEPVAEAHFVGIGQSLGGFITMIQQGIFADYAAVAVLGASPRAITGLREQPDWDAMSIDERRSWVVSENARQSGNDHLPMYHGAPRAQYRGIFHGPDVDEDLIAYDEAECHTLIPRFAGVDGMIPGFAQPFAGQIEVPLFLGFGQFDVTADAHAEPMGYPSSPDITVKVVPGMAHMHNFAGTRRLLWDRLSAWLPAVL